MITTSEDINSRARSAVVVVGVPARVILGECERERIGGAAMVMSRVAI